MDFGVKDVFLMMVSGLNFVLSPGPTSYLLGSLDILFKIYRILIIS